MQSLPSSEQGSHILCIFKVIFDPEIILHNLGVESFPIQGEKYPKAGKKCNLFTVLNLVFNPIMIFLARTHDF